MWTAAVCTIGLCAAIRGGPGTRAAEQSPASVSSADDETPDEFAEAGVCARCHVNAVLEWSISVHFEEEKSCQDCHGKSKEHVANERNEIKPDRSPHGEHIAELCARCHEEGCPETEKTDSCQDCHHSHALIDPKTEGQRIRDEQTKQLEALLEQLAAYENAMAKGEAAVRSRQWGKAAEAFGTALRLRPNDRAARRRATFVRRRLNPAIPGFRAASAEFDPQTGLPLEVVVDGLEMRMRLVPGGEYDMGDDQLTDARPVHTAAVAPFYLGVFEVTQAQWTKIMGANPSRHQGEPFPDADRQPVERISWDDCVTFIKKLNAQVAGGGFRLPTEAEWEYACRTGTDGADLEPSKLSPVAWYRANTLRKPTDGKKPSDTDDYAPRPVGTKRPNRWGLHDMQGNVWEWCADVYRPYLFDAGNLRPPAEPAATQSSRPASGSANGLRVLRGGGYADSAAFLRPTLRYADRPDHAFRWVGLRVARSVPPPE